MLREITENSQKKSNNGRVEITGRHRNALRQVRVLYYFFFRWILLGAVTIYGAHYFT